MMPVPIVWHYGIEADYRLTVCSAPISRCITQSSKHIHRFFNTCARKGCTIGRE